MAENDKTGKETSEMENEPSESVEHVAKPSILHEPQTSAETSQNGAALQSPIGIPPLIKQAQMAFFRDLPKLLRERPGQWVAYQGEHTIGFASNDLELYQECHRRGIAEEEFLVLCIEAEAGEVVFGLNEVA